MLRLLFWLGLGIPLALHLVPAASGNTITYTEPNSNTNVQTLNPKRRYSADYIVQADGNIVKATNGKTGAVDYSNSDARTVIQNAINALTGGGIVLIKAGTYTISGTISITNNNIQLSGEGPSTILTVPNNSMGSSFMHMIYVQANDFELHDIKIDGNQANQTAGNYMYLVQLGTESADGGGSTQEATRYQHLAVRNCVLVNAVTGQIRCFKCQNVTLENNYLQNLTGNLAYCVANIMMGWVWDFEIKNNYCDLGAQRPKSNNIIVFHSGNTNSGSVRGKVVGNTCVNCTDSPIEASSSSAGSDLNAYVQDIVIADNTVRSGAGIISLQACNIDIIGNKIVGPGDGGGNAWGIRTGCSVGSNTKVSCKSVKIIGNVIQGDRNSSIGIQAAACGGVVQGVTITNNVITDISNIGIQIDGGNVPSPNQTTDITVSGNTIVGASRPLQIVNTAPEAMITLT